MLLLKKSEIQLCNICSQTSLIPNDINVIVQQVISENIIYYFHINSTKDQSPRQQYCFENKEV